ncbi:MAG: hypothetical protein HQM11_07950 [SAR324 cluster bacterium]|nr:hypothetical protein [SAR324 cluster bacterium]
MSKSYNVPDRTMISMRIETEFLQTLDEFCEQKGLTRTKLLVSLAKKYIKEHQFTVSNSTVAVDPDGYDLGA